MLDTEATVVVPLDPIKEESNNHHWYDDFVSRHYLWVAAFAGVDFAVFNFIMSLAISQSGSFRSLYALWIGWALYAYGYHIMTTYQLYKRKGKLWTREDSAYYDQETGLFKYRLLKILLFRYSIVFINLI